MPSIKTIAFAVALAAGVSTLAVAEDAAPDAIANHEPIFGTYVATAPQTVTTAGLLSVPALPWIAERFNPNRTASVQEAWFKRAEAGSVGGDGGSAGSD